jgi:hypothetical protein
MSCGDVLNLELLITSNYLAFGKAPEQNYETKIVLLRKDLK